MTPSDPIKIAEELLWSLKLGKPYHLCINELASLPKANFDSNIANDDTKKAFWINIYNAYFLILRKHKMIIKPAIYKDKSIIIAHQKMSLDDIEHGILRRYRLKISLVYLPDIFAPSWIKNWAVKELDHRIHFALNCGAVSCPPIALYVVDKIDQQLRLATHSFLENETQINHDNNTIYSTKLFQWYQADFGGLKGVKSLLSSVFEQELQDYKMLYTDYDFTEDLDNFSDQ